VEYFYLTFILKCVKLWAVTYALSRRAAIGIQILFT